jgi:hypothetical protein
MMVYFEKRASAREALFKRFCNYLSLNLNLLGSNTLGGQNLNEVDAVAHSEATLI